ncbi:MAG: CpXC domain-containing protein [Anaerolineales bacterium]|nr:CpXC domain-containing protein [Anaerolineales bacterium]
MQTQITCPNCGTPYVTEVYQLIDVGQQPALKQLILSGQLNLAVCPNCGAGGQLSTPLVYHDPDHELFMTYIPPEMNLDSVQREQIIGRLVRQAVDNTPQEKRRAYMFQPQPVLSLQTFMENILETEGITKEMIARQRKQSELLRKLANADKDVRDYLLKDNMDLIDETFLAMLQSIMEQASQMNESDQLVKLSNLRAKLMTETPAGRRMEQQQIAVHKFNQAAKKQGGLSAELLLEHVLANRDDDAVVDAIIAAGQGALRYNFFSLFTEEIEKEEKAGNMAEAKKLSDLRARLLQIYDQIQQQTRQVMSQAAETLDAILEAEDMETAVRANFDRFDDAFMYYLASRIAQADQQGQTETVQKLQDIHSLIVQEAEGQVPPEIQLLNAMLESESDLERAQILEEHPELVSEEILEVLDVVQNQVVQTGQDELNGRLESIKAMIAARL